MCNMSRKSVSCGGYGEEGVAHISKLNELLSLKVHDICWDRNQLLVKHGKGGKDRVVMLSETLKQLLKKNILMNTCRNTGFLRGRTGTINTQRKVCSKLSSKPLQESGSLKK